MVLGRCRARGEAAADEWATQGSIPSWGLSYAHTSPCCGIRSDAHSFLRLEVLASQGFGDFGSAFYGYPDELTFVPHLRSSNSFSVGSFIFPDAQIVHGGVVSN